MNPQHRDALALLGTLASVFEGTHGLLDQWAQTGWAARNKRALGANPVDRSGAPQARAGRGTVTATTLGRQAATHHVACYVAGQSAATLLVTRVLGYRLPLRALVAGALINGITHWVIDRHWPLVAAARATGKQGYLRYGTVVRCPGQPPETTGPGTAHFELDQSAHRAIGLAAATVTAWLATRRPTRPRG